MKLTENDLNFYQDNGYLHLKSVIEPAEVEALRSDAKVYARGHYSNYLDLHTYGHFSELHRGETLCSIADQIIGGRAIPIGSIFFFCKPENEEKEKGSVWHQDNYAPKAPYGAYLNIAVSLDFADASNGALQVIPGSHKLGDLPCNPKKNFVENEDGTLTQVAPIGNDCVIPEDAKPVTLEYSPGDVIVVHAHLVHKADRNQHPTKWRRTMYFVYIREGAPFWPGFTAKRTLIDRFDAPVRPQGRKKA